MRIEQQQKRRTDTKNHQHKLVGPRASGRILQRPWYCTDCSPKMQQQTSINNRSNLTSVDFNTHTFTRTNSSMVWSLQQQPVQHPRWSNSISELLLRRGKSANFRLGFQGSSPAPSRCRWLCAHLPLPALGRGLQRLQTGWLDSYNLKLTCNITMHSLPRLHFGALRSGAARHRKELIWQRSICCSLFFRYVSLPFWLHGGVSLTFRNPVPVLRTELKRATVCLIWSIQSVFILPGRVVFGRNGGAVCVLSKGRLIGIYFSADQL